MYYACIVFFNFYVYMYLYIVQNVHLHVSLQLQQFRSTFTKTRWQHSLLVIEIVCEMITNNKNHNAAQRLEDEQHEHECAFLHGAEDHKHYVDAC